jgi:hypothetical protein
VVEPQPSKHKVLSSNPTSAKTNKQAKPRPEWKEQLYEAKRKHSVNANSFAFYWIRKEMGRQDVCRDTTHNTTIFYVYMKQKFWHQH